MKNKKSGIEITEIFMANPYGDFSRCFQGTIKRGQDCDGNSKVWGKIDVNSTTVVSCARDQWELGEKLDLLTLIVIEMGLHSDAGDSIPNGKISLN